MSFFKTIKQIIIDSYRRYINERALNILLSEFENESDTLKLIAKSVLTNAQVHLSVANHTITPPLSKSLLTFFLKTTVSLVYEFGNLQRLVAIQPMSGPVGLVFTLVQSSKGLEIKSSAVQSETHQLQTWLPIEAMQDVEALHSIDLEAEISQAITVEVLQEITTKTINKIVEVAEVRKVGTDFIGDINQASRDIAWQTRRGFGNFMVTTSAIVAQLKTLSKQVFVPASEAEVTLEGVSPLTYVGTLAASGSQMKVFVADFSGLDNKILIGYKGGSGEVDAGLYYCPHVLLTPTGIQCNPTSFMPGIGMKSRAAYLAVPNANQYFKVLEIGDSE